MQKRTEKGKHAKTSDEQLTETCQKLQNFGNKMESIGKRGCLFELKAIFWILLIILLLCLL